MKCPRLPARRWVALLGAGVLTTAVPVAWALDIPVSSPKDKRIRTTCYDPDNVVQVETALGVATHIVLAEDEEYLDHGFGDSAAYELARRRNHILLKPTADQADTNLIYITDKRSYAFLLKYSKQRTGREFFRLTMCYPELEQAKRERMAEAEALEHAMEQTGTTLNWEHYTMNGDMSLAPVSAWDDGAQTWLRFGPGQELPAVYMVDADGQEILVNRHMADPQTIVMHRVAALWHLRLGNQVLAVHNEAGVGARSLDSGTISPVVERVLLEEVGR